MSKFCKKCGKEIPKNSKKDTCESCQYKKFGTLRKVGEGLGGIALLVLFLVSRGKFGGGTKA